MYLCGSLLGGADGIGCDEYAEGADGTGGE